MYVFGCPYKQTMEENMKNNKDSGVRPGEFKVYFKSSLNKEK
jgi:hypothetical protein